MFFFCISFCYPRLEEKVREIEKLKKIQENKNLEVEQLTKQLLTVEKQGRKLLSCSHCHELCQQISCLLIGYARVNNQSEAKLAH